MLENDAKGSYGAFSSVGRASAEAFINIRKKDTILNPKKNKGNNKIIIGFLKRNKYDNIEGDVKKEDLKEKEEQNLDDSEVEDIEEEVDIFEINEEEEKKKKEEEKMKKKKRKKRRDSFTNFHRTNEDAYKFHDMHLNKKKYKSTYSTPNCTKYYPSKALVWKSSPSGPKWETMGSRKPLLNKIVDGTYIEHEDPLKNITKCFINMDKQTMRGDLANTHNLRVNTAKRFIPKDTKNKSIRKFNRTINESISSDGNINRIKSGRDINKKINLEINNKWKVKMDNYDKIDSTPIQTISTLENQKINEEYNINILNNEKPNKIINNIKVLTTELTESTPNNLNTVNTNINLNQSRSNVSSKVENEFEEKKNIDISIEKSENESNSAMESSELNDSYHKYKNHYTKQIKAHQKAQNQSQKFPKLSVQNSRRSSIFMKNKSSSVKSKISKNIKRPKTSLGDGVRFMEHKTHIRGPEFEKIIPREYYDNLADNGISLIPFSINNYKQVRERPLTVVIYNRKPFLKKKVKPFKGMETDQYKNVDSYNKHKAYVPIFSKMTTRPYDGNPLPVFMKGACCRDACNITTDVSLKMNCYADGKTRGNYNGFMPKKSYNKVVNLNLMNSNAIVDYLLSNRKEDLKDNNEIIRSLKFYKKYYKEILKEGNFRQFDNVTYKTIKSKLDDYLDNEKKIF